LETNILDFDLDDFNVLTEDCLKTISINKDSLVAELKILLIEDSEFIQEINNLMTYTVFPDTDCAKNFLADIITGSDTITISRVCYSLHRYVFRLTALAAVGEFEGYIGLNGIRYNVDSAIPFTDTEAIETWLTDVIEKVDSSLQYIRDVTTEIGGFGNTLQLIAIQALYEFGMAIYNYVIDPLNLLSPILSFVGIDMDSIKSKLEAQKNAWIASANSSMLGAGIVKKSEKENAPHKGAFPGILTLDQSALIDQLTP